MVGYKHVIMMAIGVISIYLAIAKHYEPLLLIPIGFGTILGNLPVVEGMDLGVYQEGSMLYYLHYGVREGIYPPLIFLGIGAMTDFSALLARPKLLLLGAAAQVGIFGTFLTALLLGFLPRQAASIGIIGGADGPTAIFLSSKLAPELLAPIAIASYSYMAMVPIIQPVIMRMLTTRKERLIKMSKPRKVGRRERIIFPIIGIIVCCYVAPAALPLLGMLFLGNLMKECLVTDRLANTASTALIDCVTIVLGLSVGASTQADVFLTTKSIGIFVLGAFSFALATASGVMFAKLMNLFARQKINPLIGAAGVSAVPLSARVVQTMGNREDRTNYLLMDGMAANVAGVIGSALAAGVLWSFMNSG